MVDSTDMCNEQETSNQRDYSFPFQPYKIQEDYMNSLFKTLQQGAVGIFESPTGTGKSLSMICGTLTWLKHFHQEEEQAAGVNNTVAGDHNQAQQPAEATQQQTDKAIITPTKKPPPKWFQERLKKRKREDALLEREVQKEQSAKNYSRILKYQKLEIRRKKKAKLAMGASGEGSDNEHMIDQTEELSKGLTDDLYSSSEEESDNEDSYKTPKIIYASRTHTQLSQFVNELKRTKFHKDVKVVQLASRSMLCINDTIRQKAKGNTQRLNELCIDLEPPKEDMKEQQTGLFTRNVLHHKDSTASEEHYASKKICPYLDKDNLKLVKAHLQVQLRDIEEAVQVGKRNKGCPYYASRKAIPLSDVVTVPYHILLSKAARESVGLSLQNCIIIIDEGHNVVDTINSIHSREVDYVVLNQFSTSLAAYHKRFEKRLLLSNSVQLKLLIEIAEKLAVLLKKNAQQMIDDYKQNGLQCKYNAVRNNNTTTVSKIIGFTEKMFDLGLDNINMFELQQFIRKSEIVRKLNGVLEKQKKEEVMLHTDNSKFGYYRPKSGSWEYTVRSFHFTQLHSMEGFLLSLTNEDDDGRLMIVGDVEYPVRSCLKFVQLNPDYHFGEVLKEAKSVVLTGGTMHPMDVMVKELMPDVDNDRLTLFSCGHIIDKAQLTAITLPCGPSKVPFNFTYANRSNNELMIKDLGNLVRNIVNLVPYGVVLFFPSYHLANDVYEGWEKSGLLAQLEMKKKFLREPKTTEEVQTILTQYKQIIDDAVESAPKNPTQLSEVNHKGAILSCVMGGKMSEGINFSDNYARCVAVVGMPYPPKSDPLLQEKMKYANKKLKTNTAGDELYENTCMKTVNQSIGRAIRHKDDYAAILLLDHRYSKPNVSAKLPRWIKESLQHKSTFGAMFGGLRSFYMDMLSRAAKTRGDF